VSDVIYVCSDAGTVYALKASDGSKIWQTPIGSGTNHEDASPAVANDIVYIGARNGYYALNATTGFKSGSSLPHTLHVNSLAMYIHLLQLLAMLFIVGQLIAMYSR
jgi:outer membrane protein assembly factor BamB